MSVYSDVMSSQTVSSGGGSESSSVIDCFRRDTLTLKVEGDSNSSDFKLELRARFDENGSFGVYDSSVSGEDITSDVNNSRFYTYDVSDLNDVRAVVTNDAGSDTVVTVRAGVTRGEQK